MGMDRRNDVTIHAIPDTAQAVLNRPYDLREFASLPGVCTSSIVRCTLAIVKRHSPAGLK